MCEKELLDESLIYTYTSHVHSQEIQTFVSLQ